MAVGWRETGVDEESVPVLHRRVADEAELCLLARTFAIEPRFSVSHRNMRLIRSLAAVEVRFLIAPAAFGRRLVRVLFCLEALYRRPSFDQRAVDRNMIRAQEPLHTRLLEERVQERRADVAFEQPVAVRRKRRAIPDRVVDASDVFFSPPTLLWQTQPKRTPEAMTRSISVLAKNGT